MSCILSKFEVTIVACWFTWSYACDQYLHLSMKDKTWPVQAVSTQRMNLKTPSSLQSWQFLNKNFSL